MKIENLLGKKEKEKKEKDKKLPKIGLHITKKEYKKWVVNTRDL